MYARKRILLPLIILTYQSHYLNNVAPIPTADKFQFVLGVGIIASLITVEE